MKSRTQEINKMSGTILIFLLINIFLTSIFTTILNAANDPLPKAADIMDKFVEVTGGMKTYEKIKNRITKSTVEITTTGLKMLITTYKAKPNKAHSIIQSKVAGKIENGTDGKVAWELNNAPGVKIKEGKQKADFLFESIFDRYVYWRATFKNVKCIGLERVNNWPCYEVEVEPHIGGPQTLFFDTESHLIVKVKTILENDMGTFPMESYPDDYKEIDGIKLPYKNTIYMMGQKRIVIVTSIEHNGKLPPNCFDLPTQN